MGKKGEIMSIILLGLNHKSASVEIREKVAMSKPHIRQNVEKLRNLAGVNGISILSTCNRTEFYLDAEDNEQAKQSLLAFIAEYSGV